MTDTDRMVVWLRETMDAAEAIARATTPVPVPGEWSVVRDKHADDDAPLALIQGQPDDDYEFMGDSYKYGLPVIADAAEWQAEAEANLRHIARHDPAAVLRQIDRHRKILDQYDEAKRVMLTYTEPDDARFVGAELVVLGQIVRLLAEGYGWTEETT